MRKFLTVSLAIVLTITQIYGFSFFLKKQKQSVHYANVIDVDSTFRAGLRLDSTFLARLD